MEGGIAADVGHGERGDIVPDVQGAAVGAAREGLPAGDRALEARVARVAQRRSEVGLDVAQLDDDVLPWPRARRESRPFVRQRLNESMRELIFDGLGDGVHRTEERAAWTAFLLDHALCRGVVAVVQVVLLGLPATLSHWKKDGQH